MDSAWLTIDKHTTSALICFENGFQVGTISFNTSPPQYNLEPSPGTFLPGYFVLKTTLIADCCSLFYCNIIDPIVAWTMKTRAKPCGKFLWISNSNVSEAIKANENRVIWQKIHGMFVYFQSNLTNSISRMILNTVHWVFATNFRRRGLGR